MKTSLALFLFFVQTWQTAQPGYQYVFPRDHFAHPNFKTEWWYYTGNLQSPNGHRFGYELTFFSQATGATSPNPVWNTDRLYLAHLALSDIDGKHFYHSERLNRAGPGLAGPYQNGNWKVNWKSGEAQQLQAVSDQFTLTLDLSAAKPLIINGEQGISRKGPNEGEASHYITFTRLAAKGQLTLNGTTFPLTGLSWMDHEFFTEPPSQSLAGWDWFAIQLENNEEIMLYRLRSKSGVPNAFSSATFVDAHGAAHHLNASQFSASPSDLWESPKSKTRYPLSWEISIPSLDLQLSERTELKEQELYTPRSLAPSYWEGAVNFNGRIHGKPVKGVGYLEMTGYGKEPLWLGN